MPPIEMVQAWRGRTLLDRDGDRVGSIQEIYLDAQTDEPEWALVHTGLFGMKSSFVPIQDAVQEDDQVRVPFEKQLIKDAPRVDPDGELSELEEADLYPHYGMDVSPAPPAADAAHPAPVEEAPGLATPVAGATPEPPLETGDVEAAAGERGRGRLRRYV